MLSLGLNMATGSVMQSSALLLDTYGSAAAAYSLRRLATGHAKALQIRRDLDNTEVDVYFDTNGVVSLDSTVANVTPEETTGSSTTLTTSAANLGEFVAAGGTYTNVDSLARESSAWVQCWYDQSGNGNDATQVTAGSQPQIVSAGALIVENGKPVVRNRGGTQELTLSSSISNATNIASVAKADTVDWNMLIGQSYDGGLRTRNDGKWYPSASVSVTIFQYQGGIAINGTELTTTTAAQSQQLIFSTAISGGYPYALLQLGGTYTNRHWDGPIQEFILWTTDQSDNRTGIETNINTFYSIY